jgi:hypothetical protein
MKILYLIYLKIILSEHEVTHGSAVLKSNKLYVYEPADYSINDSTVTVYDLKDGPISQITNSTYKVTNVPNSYMPKFLKFPQGFSNDKSDQTWLIGGQSIYKKYDQSIYDNMWTGQFVNSTNLNFDNSFIKKPDFDNFPIGGYSQDIVNINNNPVMYIIGGFFYSPDKETNIFTSSMFKYDFTSNSWSDLSESSNSILPPIADHQTVIVDNFLLVTNGLSPNLTTTQYPQTAPYNSNAASLNYYDKAYKFDLLNQKWSLITIKTNLDESIYRKGHVMSHMHGASLNVYKGSLYAYTLIYNLKTFIHEPRLAVLDYNSWEWRWYSVDTDIGADYILQLAFHQSMIIKDQLLLIHGK